jgi:drug/metabolite transporter (DMT)-like permease
MSSQGGERLRMTKTYFLLACATIIWGSAFIGGKIAVNDFEPMTVAFLRFFGATIILIPLLKLKKQWPKQIALKDWGLFFILGLTGIFLYNFAFFLAAKHSPVIKNSLFIATNPIVITILSGWLLREAISKNQIIGLLCAALGVFYVIINGRFSEFLQLGFQPIDGVLLLAVISWALYTVVGKVVLQKYSPLVSTTFACALGSLMLLPFAIAETSLSDITQASVATWFWIVEMAVLVTVISFLWWYRGVQEVGASKAALFINFMPISAVLMAFLFLGEELTFHHIIGSLLIFFGVYLGTVKKRKASAAQVQHASGVSLNNHDQRS